MRQLLCVLLFICGLTGQVWAEEKVLTSEKITELRAKAEQDNSQAQYILGIIYFDGKGVNQDYTKALEWYKRAADQGYAKAQHRLGFLYSTGQGVSQDYPEAVKWYRKAADQGYARSQNSLGSMYNQGWGVPQDYAKALEWYLKAANQGYVHVQFDLGMSYYQGQGVNQSYEESYFWLTLAEIGGDKKAISLRAKAEAKLTPAQISEVQKRAREWKPVVTEVKQ
jgi:uncharacterized protein